MYQVRDGKRVVPTCPECGCRLAQFEDQWWHYEGIWPRDARGCICPSATFGYELIDPNDKFDKSNIVMV